MPLMVGRSASIVGMGRRVRPRALPFSADRRLPRRVLPFFPAVQTPRDERPGTFEFLGFTHYWGRTLKGNWAVKRKTAGGRLRRSLASVAAWCREHRHDPVKEQWAALTAKLLGHFAYYGIAGNIASLRDFRDHVRHAWQKWLSRRSNKAAIAWQHFSALERRYPLPPARLRGVRLVT